MMTRLLLYLCFAFAPATLFAQSWYQVNIVVFENRNGVAGEEVMDQQEGIRYEMPSNGVVIDAIDENGDAQGFQRTTIIDQEFSGVVASLQRSSAYKVLLVKSWRQPGLSREQAIPVVLQGGQAYGEHFRLEGTVNLILSRYLHLETDLWLGDYVQTFAPSEPAPADAVGLPVEDGSIAPANQSSFEATHLIRMQDTRRMRSKELHYLDHPLMGVIVKVIPLK